MWSTLVQTLAISLLLPGISAQTDRAVCSNSTYSWSFTKSGQSPCEVGTSLGKICRSSFSIQALEPGFYYSGLVPPTNDCVCNTVYYSLLTVCAACQGSYSEVWPQWNVNCSRAYTDFPRSIPANVSVPHWAYLPLSRNGTIDAVAVVADNEPEVTGTGSSSTPSPNDNKGGNKAPIGAIVGGVVGGLVFIGVITAIVILLLRRRRNRTPPSAAYANSYAASVQPPLTPNLTEKPYDPNDPSTFPPSPNPTNRTAAPAYNNQPGWGDPYNTHGNGTYGAVPTTPPPDGAAQYQHFSQAPEAGPPGIPQPYSGYPPEVPYPGMAPGNPTAPHTRYQGAPEL